MDVSQYLDIFIEEGKEHLQSLNEHLLILEKEPENENTINEIFRAAHSLKGMSGTMGYKRMQRLTHDMENVFSEIRGGKMKVSSELIDVLFKGLDALETYISNIQSSADEGAEDYEDIIDAMNNIMKMGLDGNAGVQTKVEPKEEPQKEPVQKAEVVKAAVVEEVEEKAVVAETTQTMDDTPNKEQENNDLHKYKYLHIEDHEKKAIAKATMVGLNVVGLTIYIQDYCVLKGARAFMVNRTLEEYGEIIKLSPSAQELEEEKYDHVYSAFVITEEKPEKLLEVAMNVSEVKEVVTGYISLSEEEINVYTGAIKADETPQAVEKPVEAVMPVSLRNRETTSASSKPAAKPATNRSLRVDIDKLDVLMNLVSELIIAKNGLISISSSSEIMLNSSFHEQIEYLERITTNLHESVVKTRMVPIESVFNRFPRMIRDLNKKLDKDMELYITGEETELDRTVIDEIGDPLMHLLRNAADHGIESKEERKQAGKSATGSIFMDAYQDGNNVVIEVRDDGGGINTEKVKNKAIKKGVISEDQAERMSEKDFIDLLFKPSFTTSDTVSDISGRGVGLDVVKTKIETLGGEIECRSILGEGSNFIIRLPLTLAIIQSLMVIIGGEKYALPLGSIQTVENIPSDSVKSIQGKEVINMRGMVIPVVRLADVLDCTERENEAEELLVVIVKKGEKYAGMVVDDLVGQQEIVIKSIGNYIRNYKVISGATILGNGEVALILDVNSLV